eukprot:COSAG05_NODE_2025_length_3676_cov_2.492715_1_plen_335_part_10
MYGYGVLLSGSAEQTYTGFVSITAGRRVLEVPLRLKVQDVSSYFVATPQTIRATLQPSEAFVANLYLFNTAPGSESINWEVAGCGTDSAAARESWLSFQCSGTIYANERTNELQLTFTPRIQTSHFETTLDVVSVYPQENLYTVDVAITVVSAPLSAALSTASRPEAFTAGQDWRVAVNGKDKYGNSVTVADSSVQLYMELKTAGGGSSNMDIGDNLFRCPFIQEESAYVCEIVQTEKYGHGNEYTMVIFRAPAITFIAASRIVGAGAITWNLQSPNQKLCLLDDLDTCACSGGPYTLRAPVPHNTLATSTSRDTSAVATCGGAQAAACVVSPA